MDFLSIILSAIGWEKDRASKASDRKIEVYRLNAEVAAECMRTVSMLDTATPGILRRCQAMFPDQPEIFQSCSNGLAKMRSDAFQIQSMAENYKAQIEKGNSRADWDSVLMQFHEWRATVAQIYPRAEATVQRMESLLAQAEQSLDFTPQPPVSQRKRDRGWDAPPL
ncbi:MULTISPECIES: hypothetical protein [unclassified Rhizobium]|uniref:hypothetical protein n=1 Tax=unclassified Rhizobium TaxID=2613769 RepID=UPI000EAAB340|nr:MULTISPECIES: hypothetical protein [unclassified Rhizobium]AYG66981.1 hypothetical protein CCGE531_13950 [Rhizobium sp. CCGE531]AYG73362.1 hypothetical protein CCGE532_13370 [Rhizobium sp. CCGE532]